MSRLAVFVTRINIESSNQSPFWGQSRYQEHTAAIWPFTLWKPSAQNPQKGRIKWLSILFGNYTSFLLYKIELHDLFEHSTDYLHDVLSNYSVLLLHALQQLILDLKSWYFAERCGFARLLNVLHVWIQYHGALRAHYSLWRHHMELGELSRS